MQTIKITIINKRAQVEGSPVLVCNNTGDKITFSFDDEWTGLSPKIARFVYTRDGRVLYQDVAFTADTVEIPPLSDISCVRVGVYAGELSTTTAAVIPCIQSILSGPVEMDGSMIFPSDYGRFKLWNDITIEEDVTSVSMSKTDDEKPLNIKKFFAIFTGKVKEKSSLLTLRFNGGNMYQMWNMFSRNDAETDFTIWMFAEKIAPGVFLSRYSKNALGVTTIDSIQGLSNANSEVGSALTRWANQNAGYQKATSWTFGATSDLYKLRTGSRILVWGVQDDD